MDRIPEPIASTIAVFFALATAMSLSIAVRAAQDAPGAVYVLNNQSANKVMVYARAANGSLSFSGSFSTGGAGMGTGPDPLASQDSLVLDRWHQLLFAVNAGSNEVSVFAVRGLDLSLLDRKSSGGILPVSVAVQGNLVYVLNAGDSTHDSSMQGFFVDPANGHLTPLAGSSQDLGPSTGAADVAFSPDGAVLMVTEKATNELITFTVDDDGFAHNLTTTSSSGAVPFGFTFARRDFAIVTEAGPSALSSYEVENNGNLDLVTATLKDGNAANCWVVATSDGKFAFTTNTASGNISSYVISRDGSLTLQNGVAASTGMKTAPIDEVLSTGSRFLYVRVFDITTGANGLEGFLIRPDGSLVSTGSVTGIPAGAQGLAAR